MTETFLLFTFSSFAPQSLGRQGGHLLLPFDTEKEIETRVSVVCLKEESLRRGCVCLVVRNTGSLGTDLLRGDTKIPTLLLNM